MYFSVKPAHFTLKKRALISLSLINVLQMSLIIFAAELIVDYLMDMFQMDQNLDYRVLQRDSIRNIAILYLRIVTGIAICLELTFGALGAYLENLCLVGFYLSAGFVNLLLEISLLNKLTGSLLLITGFQVLLSANILIVGLLFMRDLRILRQNRAAGELIYYDNEQIKV